MGVFGCVLYAVFLLLLARGAHCSEIFQEHGWETLQVVPHVSGLRLENLEGAERAFLGYTEAGETIVEPDTPVHVVVFGFWLDKVEYVTFTDSNCITSEFNISNKDFDLQTERRIDFEMSFPDFEESWRLCLKQIGKTGELRMVDEIHTWISTSATIQEYYMPFWVQCAVIISLFLQSALFSGLNLGLMSLSTQELSLLIKCGSPSERRYAEAILPVRRRGNYLLCTILIMNVVVNASISILFENLFSGFLAFLASSLGIVVLGEIVPQSVCVKKGLSVGAKTLFLTKFFMFITKPIAYPISKILDVVLGEEVDRFDRNRLLELMKMSCHGDTHLAEDLRIAVGAMEIARKSARDVMTKITDVYMLSSDTIINSTLMAQIVEKGYTRIPIYENNDRNQVVSLLFVKDLALVNKNSSLEVGTLSSMHKHRLRFVSEYTPLTTLLDEFKAGEYHLAMVHKALCHTPSPMRSPIKDGIGAVLEQNIALLERNTSLEEEPLDLVGLITLEDIVEEILQAEILDESDMITDNVQRETRRFKTPYRRELAMRLLGEEEQGEPISVHTKIVLTKILRDEHPLFSSECMEQRSLEKLIEKNVRQIRNSSTLVKLFECGKPSRRAVLILEGKASAYFPKSDMRLQAGPWITFGDVLIQKLEHYIIQNSNEPVSSLFFVPDFDMEVSRDCKFVQFPVAALLHAIKVTKVIRAIATPPGSPDVNEFSRNGNTTKSVRFKGSSPKLSMVESRERNGSVNMPSDNEKIERKASEARLRSVSTLSARRV